MNQSRPIVVEKYPGDCGDGRPDERSVLPISVDNIRAPLRIPTLVPAACPVCASFQKLVLRRPGGAPVDRLSPLACRVLLPSTNWGWTTQSLWVTSCTRYAYGTKRSSARASLLCYFQDSLKSQALFNIKDLNKEGRETLCYVNSSLKNRDVSRLRTEGPC